MSFFYSKRFWNEYYLKKQRRFAESFPAQSEIVLRLNGKIEPAAYRGGDMKKYNEQIADIALLGGSDSDEKKYKRLECIFLNMLTQPGAYDIIR